MNKLLAESTKSRPCHSLDNALVEGNNGAVIRKLMGYGHIPAQYAGRIGQFHWRYFNPYLNFDRAGGVARLVREGCGRRQRIYSAKDCQTPYQKEKCLPQAEQ